jgi:hypothetical protein
VLWLETWVTDGIVRALARGESAPVGTPDGLPAQHETLKIRGLYRVLDRLRQFRMPSVASLNMTMAVEALLLEIEHALNARAGQRTGAGQR